ncbi:MAG: DUF3556 domain-containing protein [bacterium]|nr:DUF3556 domain-containing protein [bacterium]
MTTAQPDSSTNVPPFPPERIANASSYPERTKLVAQNWAYASPNRPSVMALYWIKYLCVLIPIWAFWCTFNAGYTSFFDVGSWAMTGEAFKKAMVWSMCWELFGFGCGWGPMNARFDKWYGGYRHFARTGTIKLPLFPGVPLIGGNTRNWLDVSLYSLNQILLLWALIQPEMTPAHLLPCFVLVIVNGILDKTLYLMARSEHYLVVIGAVIFAFDDELWVSGAKLTWSFIWIWAAVSKWNMHFPSVIMVMMNNGPFFPKALKKNLFANYPDDITPSRFAHFMAAFGHLSEFAIPFILFAGLATGNDLILLGGCILFTGFHGFIGLNNPAGMPVEWNILMIYGGWNLFWFHPTDSIFEMTQAPVVLAVMLFSLVVIPTLGNFFPSRLSFLLSMRYYAGNWAYNVWLFKKDSNYREKIAKIKKPSTTVLEQLEEMIEDPTELAAAKASMSANRQLHLQGRPLLEALSAAVGQDIDDYEFQEGETFGGTILGWNFGDGHLNGYELLEKMQPICGFEKGELKLISVESQPLFNPTMHWRVYCPVEGKIAEGITNLKDYKLNQPWPEGEIAAALTRG